METKNYDVVLIGYGPVGVLLANMLGRDGHSVLAIDRMPDIYDKPRAINIDHEVMRALQSLGLADEIEAKTISHPGTDFVGMNERVIKVFEPPVKPYPLHWSPNLMFIQPEFEPVLRQGAERFAGVTALLGATFLELKQDGDGVDVAFERNGARNTVRAKYAIGCDGGASSVRKQLGVQQDSLDFDEWWTVIDAWQTRPTPLPRRTRQYCLPSGPATYVVGPKTLRRWEIKLLPGETPDDFDDADHVRKRLSAYVDPDAIDLWRVATYRFHALVAHQWQVGHVFLAGDAAHQMPPFMAQGLCSGVRDAVNLGWKLSGVLREQFDKAILASYEEERKPHIRKLVATAKHLGEIIGELDVDKARERDERLGDELDSGRAVTLRQRLIPDLEQGILAHTPDGRPAPMAGTLFPQPEVRTAKHDRVLLDDIVGENFLVVLREEDDIPLPNDGIEYVALNLLPAGATPSKDGEFVDLTGTLSGWFDKHGADVAVVRPDKYVFGIAPSLSDLPFLLRQLRERLSPLPSKQSHESKRIAG
ncbi:bifunctional 3-(3-hydroxy-phenyl)propionate/3-hydroxycinnamic acid hydroxylase [Rhizobium rhizogenes]|uniref:bifunctional 3-(3-hydroxy-phenyl)propionate/3-hydroxycinnamic acid hydroxylase n=1 Tax=Rhizobium rhizogenes TaxID=359 RepID=UPI001573EBB4|nr:bifunctional 3-(3-hydroxy-phenyl)propionate/3-hydroxycinnamic acid hydroxylase [Rhizobium rhizogenes]NTF96009.1 bifunctional 3-(3-hydroxy-phenyl)propionate/3-hydroxycinnamic acid hydroxylase [Rhizobium rhizogenes]